MINLTAALINLDYQSDDPRDHAAAVFVFDTINQ